MIGAIIGDIIGSRFEFNNTFDYNFKLFSDECSFTDDTICTIAVADAILKGEGFDTSLWSWCRKYPNPMGCYGGSFSRWVRATTIQPPYNSFGNGAAMRVSPVGWAYCNENDIIREAMETARITHNHTEGLIGAVAVAQIIFKMRDSNKSLTYKKDELEQLSVTYYGESWEENVPAKGVFDETCQGCVPLAFKIIKESISFEDAIRKAISYGGDSDTLGAIVGSIAEACFGIDKSIIKKAVSYLPDEIKSVIKEFYTRYYDERRASEILPILQE